MCVGRGPGIRRPKKFNSLSRISDRSDPDQLVNKLSRVSLINNAEQSHHLQSAQSPGQADETSHDHRAIRVITGDPGSQVSRGE